MFSFALAIDNAFIVEVDAYIDACMHVITQCC